MLTMFITSLHHRACPFGEMTFVVLRRNRSRLADRVARHVPIVREVFSEMERTIDNLCLHRGIQKVAMGQSAGSDPCN